MDPDALLGLKHVGLVVCSRAQERWLDVCSQARGASLSPRGCWGAQPPCWVLGARPSQYISEPMHLCPVWARTTMFGPLLLEPQLYIGLGLGSPSPMNVLGPILRELFRFILGGILGPFYLDMESLLY